MFLLYAHFLPFIPLFVGNLLDSPGVLIRGSCNNVLAMAGASNNRLYLIHHLLLRSHTINNLLGRFYIML